MENPLSSLDWSLLQAFLAVADNGSLSGAARILGVSQPTIGRRIQTLEMAVGGEVFRRQRDGMVLTDLGASLIAPADAMRRAANEIALVSAGAEREMAGTVRISASVFTAHYIAPRIVSRIRAEEPGVEIELVASDQSENLLFREADIAIRMYRPQQLDVVTLFLGEVQLGLFGAKAYLDRVGRPATTEDLRHMDFVGYDKDDRILRGFREVGWSVERSFFKTRCDNQAVYWQLVKSGCGLGFSQRNAGITDPDLEEVQTEFDLPTLQVWLTAHAAIRQVPRIRRVWDILREELPATLS
ncbi:MAG: LysR family transcriptional regulator [Pseudomonadota bacterium]